MPDPGTLDITQAGQAAAASGACLDGTVIRTYRKIDAGLLVFTGVFFTDIDQITGAPRLLRALEIGRDTSVAACLRFCTDHAAGLRWNAVVHHFLFIRCALRLWILFGTTPDQEAQEQSVSPVHTHSEGEVAPLDFP